MSLTHASAGDAADVVRGVASGRALDDEARAVLQAALDLCARGPSASLKELLPGKVIFHPRLQPSAMSFYIEHLVPHTVEILAHASGHTTIRAGDVWFDFRGRAPAFEWMDKHRFDGVDTDLLKRVLALHPAEGLPPFAPRTFGFSVMYIVGEEQLRSLQQALDGQPQELPWEATGTRGDTCLSLATGLLQQLAPTLGVTRHVGADFFVHAFSPRSRVDVIGVYTPEALSLFDFVARVIADESTTEGRIRALLSFVPPPLQPALDAAIRGKPGSSVPAFDANATAMVPPMPPWTLGRHAVSFLWDHVHRTGARVQ